MAGFPQKRRPLLGAPLLERRPYDTPPIWGGPDEMDAGSILAPSTGQTSPLFDMSALVPSAGPEMQQGPALGGSAMVSATSPSSRTQSEKSAGLPQVDVAQLLSTVDGINVPAVRPGFFAQGGTGRAIIGGLGDALSTFSGGQATYAPAMREHRRLAAEQQRQAQEWALQGARRQEDRGWAVEDRDAKLNAPQYFMSGRDRVAFDPSTNQASVVYDGAESFEQYAKSLGHEPGTPEYEAAAQDYVLRGNGPTAYGYDVGLENERYENRVGLEGVRQRNRSALRSAPTYRDLHPRAAAPGRAAGGSGRPAGYADVYAPILAKVARGETLTAGEQQALSMRGGRGARGGIPNGQGATVRPGSRPAQQPGTRENPAVLGRPEDRQYLTKGTYYRDGNGNVRMKQ